MQKIIALKCTRCHNLGLEDTMVVMHRVIQSLKLGVVTKEEYEKHMACIDSRLREVIEKEKTNREILR